ncbi:ABC transporter ATP-binding protein [Azospira restricta]|uniref:ABC transporter ATP-binding protein n=1 Tax=Azospira restricta TaxID=404405 RepID=A0A974PWR6_9RHOO|nr:ABC transporter ATP-binding protein [Azospira restricta]QRJ62892.1 ABC transporter ATP-binding protein [Azospira restricta]
MNDARDLDSSPLLEVSDLSLGFAAGGRTLTAVSGLSLTVAAGETYALLGESGCGKSATALALMRLLPAAGRLLGGAVRLEGRDLLALPEAEMRGVRGGGMAMIFQEPATSLNPVLTVGRQIGEVLARHGNLAGDAARAKAEKLLAAVGIADPARRLDEYPFQLSGGMKQRVMIAIALAGNPRLLVADEPTTALDVTIQAQILDLLQDLQAEREMGMLLITHDLGVVARMAHRVGVMYAGELVEEAQAAAFFASPRHPYTEALFAALPDLSRRGARLATIPGQVPALSAMPAGCRFAARCPHAWERCRVESPGWSDAGDGQRVRCHLLAEADRRTSPPAAAAPGEAAASVLPAGAEPVLQVADLKVHFPIRRGILQRTVGHVRAVDGVSLTLTAGRTLALVGESGCGKTTVGKAVLQLLAPTAGSVRLDGREIAGLSRSALRPLRRRMQMVFQDPFASLNPRLTVGEIIAEGMQTLLATARRDTRAAVAALLAQVGLDAGAIDRYPHEFSGGQRQRIAIARALAVQPELLVCDEPTSALDVSVQAQILNLLGELQASLGLAYLFITHNFGVVEHLAHEVAVMYLGRIVERGTVEEVLRLPQHPYTKALLSAVPAPRPAASGTAGGSIIRLPGETPSPAKPPAGCHFHPRCAFATAECRERYPDERALSATRVVRCHLYR